MQNFLSSQFSVQAVPTLLAALFLVVSLLIGMVVPTIGRPHEHAIKLLGSLMVVGLSLIANSAFVYAVSIFVIATLVTDLEFLEKLAAIVWDRKEYWKYLIDRASPREIEEKREADALEAETQPSAAKEVEREPQGQTQDNSVPFGARQQLIAFAQRFEEQVLKAMNNGASPFEGTLVTPAVRVQTVERNRQGPAKIVDAIARRGNKHFIVEIKAYQRQPKNFSDVTYQVKLLSELYRSALMERSEDPKITPVVIIPSDMQIDTLSNGVVVLRFDQERGEFINADAAKLYLDSIAS